MTRRRKKSSGTARRGGTTSGLVALCTVIGALGVGAVILGPQYLSAEPPPPQAVPARLATHQRAAEDLAALLAGSVGILAMHDSGATPFFEIVLWLTDDDPTGTDGRPDDRELALVTHSPVMRTISVYRMSGKPVAGAERPPASDPAFCDRWRANPRATRVVIATGVAEMRIERVDDAGTEWGEWGPWGGLQRLRLTLTWSADSADGPDEASVLVDTVVFPHGTR